MVECMESWFMADRAVLKTFFGRDFNETSLPGSEANPECINKDAIANGLKNATKNTKKGRYSKGDHAFTILAQIDPEKLKQNAPRAARLLEHLRQL